MKSKPGKIQVFSLEYNQMSHLWGHQLNASSAVWDLWHNFLSSEPTFVSSSLDPAQNKLYFFFNEVGEEFSFVNEFRIPRVAQVCKVTQKGDKQDGGREELDWCVSFCLTGWCWWTEDTAEEVDVLCQSGCDVSESRTASVQPPAGRVRPPASRGQQRLRDPVLRSLRLPVVRKLDVWLCSGPSSAWRDVSYPVQVHAVRRVLVQPAGRQKHLQGKLQSLKRQRSSVESSPGQTGPPGTGEDICPALSSDLTFPSYQLVLM